MCEPLLMSKDVFESLAPDQQKAITDIGQEMEWFGAIEAKRDDGAVARVYAEKGAAVVDFSAEDIAKWRAIAEESAWKDFASKSAETAELLASARSVASWARRSGFPIRRTIKQRASRPLKKQEILASSFDRLRMRSLVFNGLALMVSLSNHG